MNPHFAKVLLLLTDEMQTGRTQFFCECSLFKMVLNRKVAAPDKFRGTVRALYQGSIQRVKGGCSFNLMRPASNSVMSLSASYYWRPVDRVSNEVLRFRCNRSRALPIKPTPSSCPQD